MKHLLLIASIICYTAISAKAQHDHSTHQQKSKTTTDTGSEQSTTRKSSEKQVANLFLSYTNLKNALVAGDVGSAASNADQFLRSVNTIDFKVISEGNVHILAKNAGKISEAKDLKKQREYFSALSSNMVTVAKAFKLSDTPIYVQYCPMKKSSWLSSEKEIRNPYYGNAMLTCGEVTETL